MDGQHEDTVIGYQYIDGPRVAGSAAARADIGAAGGSDSSLAIAVTRHDGSIDLADVPTRNAREWTAAATAKPMAASPNSWFIHRSW